MFANLRYFFLFQDKNPCLTPSKPAGTIHIIDGNVIGDITSFYKEIFLKIPNLEADIKSYMETCQLIDVPIRTKSSENSNRYVSINLGQNIFLDYSSNKIQSNLFSQSNHQTKSLSTDNQTNSSSNVLSSSIQAGFVSDLLSCLYFTCRNRQVGDLT